jgi:hypothetical protein
MQIEIIHSFILMLTMAFAFIFSRSQLSDYQLQVSAVFFIIYFLLKRFSAKKSIFEHRLFDGVVFTFIIVSIVNTTGGITSPLFFLTYFLIFALTLLLEPIISISTTLTLIILYLLSIPEGQTFDKLIPLFSLPFLTPFALFLGQQYQKVLIQKNQIKKLRDQTTENRKNTFYFMSLVLKNHVKTIHNALDNFVGENEVQKIRTATHRIEKLIDEYESEI